MAGIRNTLTYLVSDTFTVQPGQRVQVPLATRKATGIVLRAGSTLPPGIQARSILRVLDPEPVLNTELLELGLWIADYYVAPIGEVYRAMLPLRADTRRARTVRLSALGQQKVQEIHHATEEPAEPAAHLLTYLATRGSASLQLLRQRFSASLTEALKEKWLVVDEVDRERTQRQVYAVRLGGPIREEPPRLSPAAKRILEALRAQGAAGDHRELLNAARADFAALKRLSAAGLVELAPSKGECHSALQTQESTAAGDSGAEADSSLVLTAAQSTALDALAKQMESGQFQTVLLHGITGSGKTEV